MLKKILASLGIVIVLVVFIASFQPSDYRISRSIVINAPANTVFNQVNNLRKMNEWSPWVKLDLASKLTYEGPNSGTGAKYSWESKETGSGTLTIVETKPNEFVKTKLDFFKPFPGNANADFILNSEGKQTSLTWTMNGKNNFLCKILFLFMNQDKMIGSTFESGLTDLKAMLESRK